MITSFLLNYLIFCPQGRVHALSLCTLFNIGEIRLWNRTEDRALNLAEELNQNKQSFKIVNVQVSVAKSVAECVNDADIVCTATSSHDPLLFRSMLKDNVHINGKQNKTFQLIKTN